MSTINYYRKASILILLIIFISACNHNKQEELIKLRNKRDALNEKINRLEKELNADSSNISKGYRVTVTDINYTDFTHYIEVQGKVDGDNSVNVYCEGAGGLVEEILVREGQQVSKNQVLAKIDDKIYQEQLKSNLTNLEYVTTMYNKQKALWEQKIGSEVQYLELKTRKESLESSIAALKEQINMCYIKSPVVGTVEDIPIKKGQLVAPAIVCFRVVNLTTLKITADVAEGYSNKVQVGDNVEIYLPDIKKELIGKVDFSSKYINPTNRTFNISIRIPSNDNSIKANMIAVLRIADYNNPRAIVVPINIVQNDLKGQYILVAAKENNKYVAQKKYVTTGDTYKGMIEIKSGLSLGDKVITFGFQDIEEGQTISF